MIRKGHKPLTETRRQGGHTDSTSVSMQNTWQSNKWISYLRKSARRLQGPIFCYLFHLFAHAQKLELKATQEEAVLIGCHFKFPFAIVRKGPEAVMKLFILSVIDERDLSSGPAMFYISDFQHLCWGMLVCHERSTHLLQEFRRGLFIKRAIVGVRHHQQPGMHCQL